MTEATPPPPAEALHAALQHMAHEGVRLTIDGGCMAPLLADGTSVTVERVLCYLPGDIVVYRDSSERLVAHRLLGYYRRRGAWVLLIQADNAPGPDRGVAPDRILGKVVTVPVGLRERTRSIRCYLRHALSKFRRRAYEEP